MLVNSVKLEKIRTLAMPQLYDGKVSTPSGSAIDDLCRFDIILSPGLVDMAAHGKRWVGVFNEFPHGGAPDMEARVNDIDLRAVRRSVRDKDRIRTMPDLCESSPATKQELFLGYFVRRLKRRMRGGGGTEKAHTVDLHSATVEGNAELYEKFVVRGEIHIPRNAEEVWTDLCKTVHGLLCFTDASDGCEITADDDNVRRLAADDFPGKIVCPMDICHCKNSHDSHCLNEIAGKYSPISFRFHQAPVAVFSSPSVKWYS